MAKKKTSKASVADWAWLDERFDKLERDHAAIIKLLKGGNVSKELEDAIRRNAGISVKIDRKVPDRKPTPNKKEK